MSIRNSDQKLFSPMSLSDAIDGTHVPPGSCAALTNLIPSPHTRGLFVPRPAAIKATDFTGFNTPGFISALKVIGDIAYGMISTARNAGKDEPFAYNIKAGTFTTISNITNANTPASPPTSGAWTPPIMDLVGVYLIVTHPGFNGAPNFFGWIDLTNPAAPVWNAGNTTGNALPFVPVAVAQFNDRAYFAYDSAITMTDALTLNVTGLAAQTLKFGDNTPVTALKGLSLQSQDGGIVQSLIVFKGLGNAYQVKGDPATSNLSKNAMNYAVGTIAPLSLSDTPEGIAVICPDGLRIISTLGQYSPPLGVEGDGVNFPFTSALEPSRIAASCNATVLRIGIQNAFKSGQPFEDYWYHMDKKKWSGPHTFTPSMIESYMTKFVFTPQGVLGSLWIGETVPSTTTTYTENAVVLQWLYSPSYLPDDPHMGYWAFNEMTVKLAIDPNMVSWTARALDANKAQYDSVGNIIPNTAPYWDAAIWDSDVWDGLSSGLLPRLIKWDKPIVSSRLLLEITGGSAGGVIIGDLKYNIEFLQYLEETGI
jgi:hypothetical protein